MNLELINRMDSFEYQAHDADVAEHIDIPDGAHPPVFKIERTPVRVYDVDVDVEVVVAQQRRKLKKFCRADLNSFKGVFDLILFFIQSSYL